MGRTANLGLHTTGVTETEKTFLQYRTEMAGTDSDSNMNILDRTISAMRQEQIEVYKPESYGAKGNGTADDTQGIQRAIDAAAVNGGIVMLTQGKTYRTGVINVKSNVTLDGNYAKIKLKGNTYIGAEGSGVEHRYTINTTIPRYSTSLTSLSPMDEIEEGDLMLLESKTNCLSTDAGDWQLGIVTHNTNPTHFAEPVMVSEIYDTKTGFTFWPQTIFPFYPGASSFSGSEAADKAATVAKLNMATNIVIKNLIVEETQTTTLSSYGALALKFCSHCQIENCIIIKGHDLGPCVTMADSYLCKVFNVKVKRPVLTDDDVVWVDDQGKKTDKYPHFNAFKMYSCWYCEYNSCEDENGTQSFDITYMGSHWPSIGCRVINCRSYASRTHGFTCHSGCYGTIFQNNMAINCDAGMAIRSRNSIVTGNHITVNSTTSDHFRAGIGLQDGFFCNSIVSNNFIEGAAYGIWIQRGASQGPGLDKLNTIISNNVICRTRYGISNYSDRSKYCWNKYSNTYSFVIELNPARAGGLTRAQLEAIPDSGIVIRGNNIIYCDTAGVWLENALHGVVVDGNTITGPFADRDDTYAFYIDEQKYHPTSTTEEPVPNVLRTTIINNRVTGLGGQNHYYSFTSAYPENSNSRIGGNSCDNVAKLRISPVTQSFQRPLFGATVDKNWNYNTAVRMSIENSEGNSYVQMVAPEEYSQGILFGTGTQYNAGQITYSTSSGRIIFGANGKQIASVENINNTESFRPTQDNEVSLGRSSYTWKDLYLGRNGSIHIGTTTLSESDLKKLLALIPG